MSAVLKINKQGENIMAQYKVTLYSDCEFWGENSSLCTGCTHGCTGDTEIENRILPNKREAMAFYKKLKKQKRYVKISKI